MQITNLLQQLQQNKKKRIYLTTPVLGEVYAAAAAGGAAGVIEENNLCWQYWSCWERSDGHGLRTTTSASETDERELVGKFLLLTLESVDVVVVCK